MEVVYIVLAAVVGIPLIIFIIYGLYRAIFVAPGEFHKSDIRDKMIKISESNSIKEGMSYYDVKDVFASKGIFPFKEGDYYLIYQSPGFTTYTQGRSYSTTRSAGGIYWIFVFAGGRLIKHGFSDTCPID